MTPNRPLGPALGKLWYGLYCLILLALGFAVSEMFLRLKGDRPFGPVKFSTIVAPGGRLYQPHDRLGYIHLPGQFIITLPDGYQFRATHLPNRCRVTREPSQTGGSPHKPAIWVLGCSITYGWAINDEETYPWLLQQEFPGYRVDNFGVSGYGTVHAYWQLREGLQTRPKPVIVIIAYGSFHDTRNVCSRHYRKAIVPHANLGELRFPCARFNPQGHLVYTQQTAGYAEFPLMRYSALIHRLEESYNRWERQALRHHEVSRAVMQDIISFCKLHGITVIVAGLKADAVTEAMLAMSRQEGAYALDIAVDLSIKENTNLPHDSHPSPKAHREYAARLGAYLKEVVLPALPPI